VRVPILDGLSQFEGCQRVTLSARVP